MNDDRLDIRADIMAQNVRRCAAVRDEKILAILRERGPGWAVGYRMKRDQELPDPHQPFDDEYILKMEWEFHTVQLVNGELPVGHVDFHYVVLKDPA